MGVTLKPFPHLSESVRFVLQRPANSSAQTEELQVSLAAFLTVQLNLALAHRVIAKDGDGSIDNRVGVRGLVIYRRLSPQIE